MAEQTPDPMNVVEAFLDALEHDGLRHRTHVPVRRCRVHEHPDGDGARPRRRAPGARTVLRSHPRERVRDLTACCGRTRRVPRATRPPSPRTDGGSCRSTACSRCTTTRSRCGVTTSISPRRRGFTTPPPPEHADPIRFFCGEYPLPGGPGRKEQELGRFTEGVGGLLVRGVEAVCLRVARASTAAHDAAARLPPSTKGTRGDVDWMTQPIASAPIGVLPNQAIWCSAITRPCRREGSVACCTATVSIDWKHATRTRVGC